MTDNLEVLCLEGLEEALIGYLVNGSSGSPTLVYDYDASLKLLRELGYEQNEIIGFLDDIKSIDFVSPPVLCDSMSWQGKYLRGDRYYFDNGNRTIH